MFPISNFDIGFDLDFDLELGSVVGSDPSGLLTDGGDDSNGDCRCRASFHEPRGTGLDRRVELHLDGDDCPGAGDLAASPPCRERAIRALASRDADVVRSRHRGRERRYVDGAAGLLLAAGRFVERAEWHDERLADRAARDPLAAAREATGRAGPVREIAVETGLAAGADRVRDLGRCASDGGGDGVGRGDGVDVDDADADDVNVVDDDVRGDEGDRYAGALRAFVGPTVARSRVAGPPPGARLLDRRTLDSGAVVRRYGTADGRERYCLDPVAHRLDDESTAVLAAARDRLAAGAVDGGERAPHRAVKAVVDAGEGGRERGGGKGDTGGDDALPVERLGTVLARYTRGNGVVDALFGDPRVSDAFVTAPAAANPVRVTVDGETLPTNARLTPTGAATLASRFRRASGRSFSRAAPTLDAAISGPDDGRIRVAGVTDPASDGVAFAFRRHGGDAFTLPALVANGTLPADAAALLSLAVERAAATLVAGTRGAGKTTLLGTLLWELPESTRTVTVEDTSELPVEALQREGRDVQPLYAGTDADATLTPTDALRTALRLGEGALVVGEVRGEEAAALYEAMRVGAGGSAVLGTIHGDGGEDVRERVVADLGVTPSAFGATDLVVTCGRDADGRHRVNRIEEVRTTDSGVRFATLFEVGGGDGVDEVRGEEESAGLRPTGTVDRGNSRLVASLARPDESYADVLDALGRRESAVAALARTGRTRPATVTAAYRSRRGGGEAADEAGGGDSVAGRADDGGTP